uniref:Glutathione S-transferase omega n=1 Tax=Ciona savignyi TaxID=51511 RepID=H2ZQ38_CIOSA
MVVGHGMGNSVHLREDSVEPSPPAKGVLRVYGMKFCPYVHRLKLVLAAKGVKHETVNINLKSKPKWYFAKNPAGKVPTIECDGIVIYESDITSEYADAVYPGRKLATTEPLKLAKEKMLLSHWAQTVSNGFYRYGYSKDDEVKATAVEVAKTGFVKLAAYLESNGSTFICGSQPGLTDYMLYPHLERMNAILPVKLSQYPPLKAYFDKMQGDPAVQACRFSDELHCEFVNKALAGSKEAYDIGPVEK